MSNAIYSYDEDVARMLLYLEGCSLEPGHAKHKYAISHPKLSGITVHCDTCEVAYTALKCYFKVISDE